jgi:hypothetical protein
MTIMPQMGTKRWDKHILFKPVIGETVLWGGREIPFDYS